MSTRLKVLGGTRSLHAPRLCDSCSYSVIRRGASESDEQIHCTATQRPVRTRIVECTSYVDKSQPSLWDMRQIAWVLQTDSRRERIGFLRAREWQQKHEGEDLLPSHFD